MIVRAAAPGSWRWLTPVWRRCWALPATAIGLAVAALALYRGRVSIVDGVIEAHGPWLRWALTTILPLRGGAAAMTLGHVVVGQDQSALDLTRMHERVHVRQYERWGVFFLPAYLVASLYALLRGGHYYLDNVFEREARNEEAATGQRARRLSP